MKTVPFRILIAMVVLVMALGAPFRTAVAQPSIDDFPEPNGPHGVRIADIDLAVDPGDDFYHFANGGWAARTELQSDRPSYGAMDEAADRVSEQIFSIIAELEPDPTTPEGKVRTLFEQTLDTRTRDRQGIDPVRPILESILDISSIDEGLEYQERSYNDNMFGLFVPYGDASPEDASTNVAWLAGPFLNLPSEDWYLDNDSESEDIRDAWVDTTTLLLMEIGYDEDDAATAAEAVLEFETEIARVKTPNHVLQSDPNARNNPRAIEELEEIFPGFDWSGFLEANGLEGVDTLHVVDIEFLESIQDILDEADPRILQYIFATELIWGFSSYLTTDIEEIAFSFQGTALLGIDEQEPIEARALSIAASVYPDSVGRAYVDVAFSPEAKARIEDLVDNLIAAFRIRIEQSTWMSEETMAQALEKLDLISVKVGYPDEWDTYEEIEIGDSLFESVENAFRAENQENLASIGEPVDRSVWHMAAFEVNAYYDPTLNEIVFPAAILQAPFFDPEADLASNYGSIGAIIGHEITHGFDLSGSQFDGHGSLVDWWTEDDITAFSELNERVVDHYSGIEVLPGLDVDGGLTVTENVADMGGVQVAYDALLIALNVDGQVDQPLLFTQQQRFFIAFAGSWRDLSTPEFTELLVAADEHAPSIVRAVEPLRQMDEFFEAFDIGPGDPMYLAPEDRIVIW